MRIGIFGGTFDPIHLGHLILAEQCREQCQLDEVWFVPALIPPHKQTHTISPAATRCAMIEFAISGNSAFKLERLELERTGPSYTVTTLEKLYGHDPSRELFLLLGADSIHDLPTWREPKRILELATIVAVNRGRESFDQQAVQRHLTDQLGEINPRICVVSIPGIDISATDIRSRVREGRSIRYQVSRSVEAYILEHSVYPL
jgi:nicotinate-nucleotide adenylyltransferase